MIRRISFEGMHRSGKGTQLELFANYLDQQGIPYHIHRADGSRKGLDESIDDPYSKWWQVLRPYLMAVDENGNYDPAIWDIAYRKLAGEIWDTYHTIFPQQLAAQGKDVGYLLLDRSVLSRCFVKRREQEIGLEDMLRFRDLQGKERKTIIPNLCFVMQCEKHVLLDRNEQRNGKYEFRKRNIENYYEDFVQTYESVDKELLNLILLDADKDPKQIHEQIIERCEALYNV
ncbi:MAG: hypothetical protein ACLFP2_04205 [Candidatus Woesearchaeota archaeon]